MLANLEELVEEIKPDDIYDLLTWYPYKSSLQRFGYLLDQLEVGDYLTNLVYQYLQKESFYTVLLSPTTNQKPGSSGNRWKIDVNLKMGSDL